MGTTEKLAKFVIHTGYSDFPEEVVRVTKDHILDCLGGMLAGSRERVSQIVMKYVKNGGGVAEVGVIGGGFRTSLSNAALINGTSGHATELESVGRAPGSDPVQIVASALSVAEKFRLSGKQVLEMVILGEEFQGRLGLGAPGGSGRGHCGMNLYGTPAIAAMTSKIMKMSVDQTRMAIGLAISMASGYYRQCGSMAHLHECGIACRNGIEAAMLAKEGMTADPDLIEGEGGFCDLLCNWEHGYNLEIMTKDLGTPFYILSPGVSIKKYGCCFLNHRPLDALLQLIEENHIEYEQVDSVQVDVAPMTPKLLRYSDPQNGEQAKFSLQHSLGAALVDRKVPLPYLRPFTDGGAVDPKYKEARKKINVVVHSDGAPGLPVTSVPPVTIKLKDGRTYSKSAGVDVFKGSPENPLNKNEFLGRYENCVKGVLSSSQIQRTIDLVYNLENLDNILELMELVTFGYPR